MKGSKGAGDSMASSTQGEGAAFSNTSWQAVTREVVTGLFPLRGCELGIIFILVVLLKSTAVP